MIFDLLVRHDVPLGHFRELPMILPVVEWPLDAQPRNPAIRQAAEGPL